MVPTSEGVVSPPGSHATPSPPVAISPSVEAGPPPLPPPGVVLLVGGPFGGSALGVHGGGGAALPWSISAFRAGIPARISCSASFTTSLSGAAVVAPAAAAVAVADPLADPLAAVPDLLWDGSPVFVGLLAIR